MAGNQIDLANVRSNERQGWFYKVTSTWHMGLIGKATERNQVAIESIGECQR
jgi:hypothetical protein